VKRHFIKLVTVIILVAIVAALVFTGCAPGISEEDYNRVVAQRDQARAETASLEKELATALVTEEKAWERVADLEESVAELEAEAAAEGVPVLLLEITSPTVENRVRESPVMVSGKTAPGATVTVNDVEVEIAQDDTFSTAVELVEFEPSVITVVATLGEETVTMEIILKPFEPAPGVGDVSWDFPIIQIK